MAGSNLFTGTLDLLILQSVEDEPQHGYAIGRWIRETSEDVLRVEEGVLYPALHRLEAKSWLAASWGRTETNRRAKFYELTAAGRRALEAESDRWTRHVNAVDRVLRTRRA
jgi:transcriptional regulator